MLESTCNTGTPNRSHRGAPNPASSKRTEAKPVAQSTAWTPSLPNQSATACCTTGSRRLLTQSALGTRPCWRRACKVAPMKARSPACIRERYSSTPTRGPSCCCQSWRSGSLLGITRGTAGSSPANREFQLPSTRRRFAGPPSRQQRPKATARGNGKVLRAASSCSCSAVPAMTSRWRRRPRPCLATQRCRRSRP